MKNSLPKPVLLNYITKLILMLIFLGAFVLIVFRFTPASQWASGFNLGPMDLVLLALATLRTGRMLTYDLVAEPLRYFFTRTVPDEVGMGDTVEPRTTEGPRGALAQLFSCPICTGTWVAAIFVFALYLWPGPTRILLAILAAVGGAEVLNSIVEALCWSGEASHSQAGLNRSNLFSNKK